MLDAASKGDTTRLKKLLAIPKLATFIHPLTFDSAVHVALRSDSTKVKSTVELLLKRGADANTQNKQYVCGTVTVDLNPLPDVYM